MNTYIKPLFAQIAFAVGIGMNVCAALALGYGVIHAQTTYVFQGLGLMVASIGPIGLGQLLDCLGRTAFHAERTADLLQKLVSQQQGPQAMQAQQTTPRVVARAARVVAIFAAFGMASAHAQETGMLSGEVFIVSAGGQNYKLGLVSVGVYRAEEVLPYLAAKRQAAEGFRRQIEPLYSRAKEVLEVEEKKLRDALESKGFSEAINQKVSLEIKLRFLDSAAYYFHELPAPIATVKTDSDGRYSIAVPKTGNYIIGAVASRRLTNEIEGYFWLVSVQMNGADKKQLTLANDNETTSGSRESVLLTKSGL